jgi:O-antigen ligase
VGFGYCAASLVSAVVAPRFSFEYPFDGLLSIRLYGITSHPNGLAPFAALFMAMDIAAARLRLPTNRHWRIAGWTCAFLVLALAQSKTVIIAVVIGGTVASIARQSLERRFASFVTLIVFVCLAVIILQWIGPVGGGGPAADDGPETLSGRTLVWNYVLDLWRHNPLFGYGPYLLEDGSRVAFLHIEHWAPAQAHNQWVQALGESGIVGAFGTAVYIVALVREAFRFNRASSGATLFLIGIFLFRSMTERVLDPFLFSEEFTFHFVLFGLLIGFGCSVEHLGFGSILPPSGIQEPRRSI